MKRTAKFLALLLALLMLASAIPAFAASVTAEKAPEGYAVADTDAKINGGVTVFELTLAACAEGETERYGVLSLKKNASGVDYLVDLVSVDPETGKILVGTNGQYLPLLTAGKAEIKLGGSAVKLAVIYDDNSGYARYFVQGKPAYVSLDGVHTPAVDLPIYTPAFADVEYVSYTVCLVHEHGEYELGAYNIGKNDTARLLGFQENGLTDQIRLIAGVDTLYYDDIGFEIETFIGGVSKGVVDLSNGVVFGSIGADDKLVFADAYGYNYFAAMAIGKLPTPIAPNSYITVRAYTEIAGVRHYDDLTKIVVDSNGHYFDENGYIYQNDFNDCETIPAEWGYKVGASADGSTLTLTKDGALRMSEPKHNGGSWIYLDQCVGENYIVQADVTVRDKYAETSYMGIVFGFTKTNNFGICEIRYNGKASIYEKINGTNHGYAGSAVEKADTGFSFETDVTYTLTAIKQGNKASFFIDGKLITEGEIDNSACTSKGRVGFMSKGLTVDIDNYIVTTTKDVYDDLLYFNDFDGITELPENWVKCYGGNDSRAEVGENAVNVYEPHNNWMVYYLNEDLGTSNYIVQADVKVTRVNETSRYLGLVFRYTDNDHFVTAGVRVDGRAWIEARDTTKQGGWNAVASYSTAGTYALNLSENGEDYVYTLTAVCKGRTVALYLDGVLVCSGTYKDDLGEVYEKGMVGVYGAGIDFEVDNFVVRELGGTVDDHVLHTENFDRYAALPEGWKTAGAGNNSTIVSVTDAGKLSIIEPAGNRFVTYLDKEIGTENYEFSADITVVDHKYGDKNKYFGLVYNYININNYGMAAVRFSSAEGWVSGYVGGTEVSDRVIFAPSDFGVTFAQNGTYKLKVRCVGNEVAFYINGAKVASYNHAGKFPVGKIGFISSGMNIEVDNLAVRKINMVDEAVVYSQTESAATLADDWTLAYISDSDNGSVSYDDGKINFECNGKGQDWSFVNLNKKDANGNYLGYNPATGTNDYEVSAEITANSKPSTAWASIGLTLRYKDNDNRVEALIIEDKTKGYIGYIEWRINKQDTNVKFNIGDLIKYGQTYKFRAVCIGNQITLYVDDTQVATATIPDALATGNVGITNRGVNFTAENFTVKTFAHEEVYYDLYAGTTSAVDKFKSDWATYNSGAMNRITATESGVVQYGSTDKGNRIHYYVNKNLGYNEATKTNDYTIETTVKIISTGGSYFGLLFRSQNASDRYIYWGVYDNNTSSSFAQVNNSVNCFNSNFKPSNKGITIAVGGVYTLKLVVSGKNIKAYINDIHMADGAIPDAYVNSHAIGKVGLMCRGPNMEILDFVVRTAAEEELIYSETFDEPSAAPADWADEVGARRNGVVAHLAVGVDAKNTSNGVLLASAHSSNRNTVALNADIDCGANFVYEADYIMLTPSNITNAHGKTGPVFGMNEQSIATGASISMANGSVEFQTFTPPSVVGGNGSYNTYVKTTVSNYNSGAIHRVRVVSWDGKVTVYDNGVKIIDTTLDKALLDGRFGFIVRNGALAIDNVYIQKSIPNYEIRKDEVEQNVIRLATFNIGDFSTNSGTANIGIEKGNGTETTKAEYIAVFEEVGADIWGLQEDSEYFNGNTEESPDAAIYSAVLPNYYRKFSGGYNGKAFLSGYEFYDVEQVYYNPAVTSYAPEGTTGYGHKWFLAGKVMIDDIEVSIATLHLDWSCKEKRFQQIADILAWAEGKEYCIILGDFNPQNQINGVKTVDVYNPGTDNMYQVDWQFFLDAGFESANGLSRFGMYGTLPTKGVPNTYPWDNVFVSSKIELVNAGPVYKSWMNDHAIVVADIVIK